MQFSPANLLVKIVFTLCIFAFTKSQPVTKGTAHFVNSHLLKCLFLECNFTLSFTGNGAKCWYLKNAQYNEYLYSIQDLVGPQDDRRKIATRITTPQQQSSPQKTGWLVEPDRSPGFVTIKNVQFNQYLAATDNRTPDPQRREIFTVSQWAPAAVWSIEPVVEGQRVRIKNKLYGEYLYAAAEDLSTDKNNRKIFTWRDEKRDPAPQWQQFEINKPIWIVEDAKC